MIFRKTHWGLNILKTDLVASQEADFLKARQQIQIQGLDEILAEPPMRWSMTGPEGPSRQLGNLAPAGNSGIIQLPERDRQILAQVQAAVEQLLAIEKPVRITVSRVAKTIGHLALIEQHLDQMPLTKSYLESVVESLEDYQVRRIRWAAKVLEHRGESLECWKLVRIAGLETPLFSTN
jgi:hypothetical protein